MRFKDAKVEADWNGSSIHLLLREIVVAVGGYAFTTHGWDVLWVCFRRTPLENDELYGGHKDHLMGVHVVVPCRGADGRTQGQDPAIVNDVVAWSNGKWVYDPNRPQMMVALFEGDAPGRGSSAPHLHLQVFPTTTLRA